MKRTQGLLLFFVVSAAALFFAFQNCGQSFQAIDGGGSAEALTAAARGANIEVLNFPSGLQIIEGGATLRVPVNLSRGPQNNKTVNLSIRPAQPQDMAFMDYQMSNPSLSPGQSNTEMLLSLAIGNRPLKRHNRQFIVRADDGQVSSEKTVVVQVEPVDAPDIYLLVGQSNMVGSTLQANEVDNPQDVKYGPLDSPHPRVKQLNVNYNLAEVFQSQEDFRNLSKSLASPSFIPAEEPLHHSLRSDLSSKPAVSIGPGLAFGKKAIDLTERDVILVPAAWGGTGFCKLDENLNRSWNPSRRSESVFGGTGLFDRAIVRVNYTIEQTGGILRGILWNQGRHDSYNNECTRLYQENVNRLIQAFRSRIRQDRRGAVARGADSDVPFIGATMSQGKDARRDYSNPNAREITVDNVYRNLSNTVAHADYVNMDDIKPPQYPCGAGSCAHFGGRGYRIMGRRYYEAINRVFNRGSVDTGVGGMPSGGVQASGLVNGGLYRWDGRNWVYRPGNVCKYTGNTSDVPAANNLDTNRNSAEYLALRGEISGKTLSDCPANIQVNTGSPAPAPSSGGQVSGLVSGALYRWDGRNWVYRPDNVCKYTGNTSDVPASNNLDSNRNSAEYLALRGEISGKTIPDCPSNIQVNTGNPGAGGGVPNPAPPASSSSLVGGTLYRWDGRNFLYNPGNTCQKSGPGTDVQSANNLDLNKSSSRYLDMRVAVKASNGKLCQ